MYSPLCSDFTKNSNVGDTTPELDGFGYGSCEASINTHDDGCTLVLGLGPTPSAYSDGYVPNNSKGPPSPRLSSMPDPILKLGLSRSNDVVFRLLEFSSSTQSHLDTSQVSQVPVVDEGSTSSKKSVGYLRSHIMAPRMENDTEKFLELPQMSFSEPSATSNYSISVISEPENASVSSDHRGSNKKRCDVDGCVKGARGSTGLCIGHGGGQRCQKPTCNKGAESRTAFYKSHGGGKRCQHLGCFKSVEGMTDHCIARGGGKRCGFSSGCTKSARGKSGLCIKHGGGKRCKMDGCSRSVEGQIGLCISHGGGRRCQFSQCTKGAQGTTVFCKAHGGGKRCIFSGCTKGAEGSTPLYKGHGGGKRCMFADVGICPKSVHGGTNFCVGHGGGKRCSVMGCTKSAHGRTNYCVRHGGGKRCKFENCGKSAQGSTDYCKAHGGGKRCNWGGDGKCEKFARGKSGLCAAHTSLVHGHETNRGGMIGPGLFHRLVRTGPSFENTYSSSGVSVLSDSISSFEKTAKRQQLIPPQVLVPLSMKASSSLGLEKQLETKKGVDFEVSEGRVHGGGLVWLLRGDVQQ